MPDLPLQRCSLFLRLRRSVRGTPHHAPTNCCAFLFFNICRTIGCRAAKPFNWILTTLQTSQMVVGIAVTVKSMLAATDGTGEPCNVRQEHGANSTAAAAASVASAATDMPVSPHLKPPAFPARVYHRC